MVAGCDKNKDEVSLLKLEAEVIARDHRDDDIDDVYMHDSELNMENLYKIINDHGALKRFYEEVYAYKYLANISILQKMAEKFNGKEEINSQYITTAFKWYCSIVIRNTILLFNNKHPVFVVGDDIGKIIKDAEEKYKFRIRQILQCVELKTLISKNLNNALKWYINFKTPNGFLRPFIVDYENDDDGGDESKKKQIQGFNCDETSKHFAILPIMQIINSCETLITSPMINMGSHIDGPFFLTFKKKKNRAMLESNKTLTEVVIFSNSVTGQALFTICPEAGEDRQQLFANPHSTVVDSICPPHVLLYNNFTERNKKFEKMFGLKRFATNKTCNNTLKCDDIGFSAYSPALIIREKKSKSWNCDGKAFTDSWRGFKAGFCSIKNVGKNFQYSRQHITPNIFLNQIKVAKLYLMFLNKSGTPHCRS